jgi:predicted PurR-regulated permease PerM
VSAVTDIVDASQSLTKKLDEGGLDGLLAAVPEPLRVRLEAVQLDRIAWQERLGTIGGRVVAVAGAFLKATSDAVFSLVMLLIALIVFLMEGKRILAWLDDVVPLEHGQVTELFREFRLVGNSVIVGNFGTSTLQGLVALVGYLVAGVPSPLAFTAATFVISFVPAVGAGGVGIVASLLLLVMGNPWRALFLALWSIAVVAVVDNVARPLLVKRGARLHGALVFFAIISGIAAFGVSGLVLGPIVVTFALTLVRIYRRDFKDARVEAPAPCAPSTTAV